MPNVKPLRELSRSDWESKMGDWYVPEPNTGCWLWMRGLRDNSLGYGFIFDRGAHRYAHRVSYELMRGPIPNGMTIDHLCRCRSCVNPDHMEPVSRSENIKRGRGPSGRSATAERTHCPSGHRYDEQNTGWDRGKRRCLACHRLKQGVRYWSRRANG